MQRFDTFTFIFSVYYCNTQLLGDTQQGGPSHYCHPSKIGTNTKIKSFTYWHKKSVFHCWCVSCKNMAQMLKAISPPLHRPQLCQCSAPPPRTAKVKKVNGQYPQVWPYWMHPSTLVPLTLSLSTAGLSYTEHVFKWWGITHARYVNGRLTHARWMIEGLSPYLFTAIVAWWKTHSIEGKPFASSQCLLTGARTSIVYISREFKCQRHYIK